MARDSSITRTRESPLEDDSEDGAQWTSSVFDDDINWSVTDTTGDGDPTGGILPSTIPLPSQRIAPDDDGGLSLPVIGAAALAALAVVVAVANGGN